MIKLSVVVPVYNEEEGIEYFLECLLPELNSITSSYEVIFVNDGSQDSTEARIRNFSASDKRIRLINLVKNYGHMDALSVGLQVSKGEFVLSMDGDLQHPPEAIPNMYSIIYQNTNLDVVQAVRADRRVDSLSKKVTASIFYTIAKKITGVQVIRHAADFRIMNRGSVDVINALPEKNKILRFLIPELGFKVQLYEFNCKERYAGKSKYTLRRMIALALDSVVSFSIKPLRMMSLIGFGLSITFMFGTIITFLIWLTARTVPGWTSIFMLLLSANALILGSLGLLGEYVSKIRDSTLGRPHPRWHENNI